MGVYIASFIEEIFNGLVTGEHNKRFRAEDERVHRAVLFSPLLKLQMCITDGHLLGLE